MSPHWPTYLIFHKFTTITMEVIITIGGLKLKVSKEPDHKQIFVRGHFRVIGDRKIYVRP